MWTWAIGSKGSATQTQTGTSTYTPSPYTLGAGVQALGMAQNAVQAPFNLPTQQYAGFTPDQLSAFQQTRDVSQSAQPYYQQAQGLYNQSAQPISAANISHYMDPYAGQVLANLRETQGQQMNDVTGRLTQQAGGVGGDRIGVAQGELARQQNLATGQTLSGIYGNALSAAQQDASRQQTAASGLGNLGNAAQTSGLQGANSLYGMGLNQQGLAQNQLNAQYQNQLAQVAYPYQQAQYLAGITGGLAGALGGTTNSNTYGQATPAQPSIWSQLLGAGVGAAGLYGATNGFGGMFGSGSGNTNINLGNLNGGGFPSTVTNGQADGGRVGYADGGGPTNWMSADPAIPNIQMQPTPVHPPEVKFAPMQTQQQSGGGFGDIMGSVAKLAPFFLASGGTVGTTPYQSYADGGDVFGEDNRQKAYELLREGNGLQYRTPTGTGLPGDTPYRQPSVNADGSPIAPNLMRPDDTSIEAGLPANAMSASDAGATGGPKISTPYSPFGGSQAASETADKNRAAMQQASYAAPYPDVDQSTDTTSRQFARNPWLALASAGAGMMAGTSPFAGVNIGTGFQAGIKTLENQRKEDREDVSVNQRAKQLAMQADQHLRQYTQMTPAEAANVENQKKQREAQNAQLEQAQWKLVYDPNSGKPYWTKAGEKAVPALDENGAVTPPPSGAAPAVPTAGAAPEVTGQPLAPKPADPTMTGYVPPVPVPPAPGRFNPTNGQLNPVARQETVKMQREAAAASAAAGNMKVQLQQMEKDFQDYDKRSGITGYLLQPGTLGEYRVAVAKGLNGLFGGQLLDPKVIGAAESITKLNVRLGQEQARLLGAREAAQVIQQSIKANPGLEQTEVGRKTLLAQINQAAQRQQDFAKFVVDFARVNGGDATGAHQEFDRLNPVEKYVAAGQIAVLPPPLKATLPQAIEVLKQHRNDPKAIAAFNKDYNNTADYYLAH